MAKPYEWTPNYALALAEMPSVQDDLRLSPDQRTGVRSVRLHLDREFKAPFVAAHKAGGNAFGKLVVKYWHLGDVSVVDLLDVEQRNRLRSLQYQSLGFRALTLKDLHDLLGLLPDQIAALNRLSDRVTRQRSACAKTFMMLRKPRAEETRELDRLEAESETKAVALLTPEQAQGYRFRLGGLLPSVAGSSPWVAVIVVD